ncbi:MinD-like ATPase involved in chromosome partitioning or flagellar assembly [Diaminobutyricimonas aerilata]|uniref:MinD-like ATPase involved in chromosome partitioning or flagellar assembly n=1 Tax=Diaminobutyricimonas aerilata TaxID=1162967 RepID=A0A2M9CKJ1_9MICO|nr:MinD/ParA family protein [Diaminobutyricimonas aerilata]PJJ72406.1 MinD-like ATPase involved in chromosome partitioning or flagellar assembly [Diaminobutyricimonas aerilata]
MADKRDDTDRDGTYRDDTDRDGIDRDGTDAEGQRTDSVPHGAFDLAEPSGDRLAGELPHSLTIAIDLPAPVHEAPDDEAALAIPEVAVDPGRVESASPSTRSVEIVPPRADDHARRDRLRGDAPGAPESAAMLTADRLLDDRKSGRNVPEGRWPRLVYGATLHRVNIGDSAKVRARKALDARIDKAFEGGARFVPILTRKGGVGKTTITTLLGMALADVREDRIVAIDANPDRGTLSERVPKQTRATVRDVVTRAPSIQGFTDFSSLVSRDDTRLDILASDTDPMLSEAFDENDYNVVADLCARYYSIVLTDCGTGIVHSVMRATLQRADSVVIVSGGSVDEARLASETLTWLEANGYGELVRNAIVALNTATQGTQLVKLDEIEAHFRSRVREIVRIPYDPQLAAGSVVKYKELKPFTRDAARELAALVVDGLPTRRSS